MTTPSTVTRDSTATVESRSSSPGARVSPDTEDVLIERARGLASVIREHGERAEHDRRLPKPVLNALAEAGFQRLFLPRSLGGLEVSPITCARVVEEVARIDSAAGWALQSGNTGAWWAARIPDEGVEEIYRDNPNTLMAAAFHPPLQATEVPGGYRLTGRAPLASNVHDSTWMLLAALVMDGDQPRMTSAGPEVIAGVFPTRDAEIVDTWHTLGMRGTDSNDVAVKDVFVPATRSYHLTPEFEPGRHFRGPLYRFPGVGSVAVIAAPVLLAIAREAITELRELALRKTPFGSMKTLRDRATVQATLARAEGILRSARSFYYDTLTETWERTVSGVTRSLEQKADLLLAGVHAVKSSAEVTDLMHGLAGTSGIYTRNRLERHFRDAHTLRHHGFVSESKLETVGQVYLGLPPEFGLIAF